MQDISPQWYVLACESGREGQIAAYARSRGLEAYYPVTRYYLTRPYRIRRKLREIIERSLMPGYIFVRFQELRFSIFDSEYAPSGIFGFLDDNGIPASIDGLHVTKLMERELNGEFDSTVKREFKHLPKGIRPGGAVLIFDGPVAALCGPVQGVISKIKDSLTIKVSFPLFGKKTTSDVPLAFLKALQ